MGRVAAVGERAKVQGFGLAGVLTREAEGPDAVRAAWAGLPDDVAVVILTPAAALALGEQRRAVPRPLAVVIPA